MWVSEDVLYLIVFLEIVVCLILVVFVLWCGLLCLGVEF